MSYLNLYFKGFRKLIRRRKSYLFATGWDKSYKEGKPLDEEGNPVPWMNYPAIGFLKERLRSDMDLFEFGSGFSTLFYARHVRSVTSVEYDEKWYQWICSSAPGNVTVLFRKKDENGLYAHAIMENDRKYDVIVIDGADRPNCLNNSIAALSNEGVIILDDSQREPYRETIDSLMAGGFRVLHFEGLKPCGYKLYRTSVLYRQNNCLGI